MDDIKPKFQCTSCRRGVLNRSVANCLFCGAVLPDGVRLSPEEITAREADDAPAREKERRDWIRPNPQSRDLDALDDVIDLLGDF